MTETYSFSEFVRRRREELGKSMKDLASFLDVNLVYVSDIELGHRNPPNGVKLKKIADFLEVPYGDLIDLANKERDRVELSLEGRSDICVELGLTLANVWNYLTDRDAKKILKILK